jgi:6-phosphogluconolactonase
VKGPKPPVDRLTITPPVIRDAKSTLVLVTGADKANALARVFDPTYAPESTPGQLALAGIWIVDQPAASRLGART